MMRSNVRFVSVVCGLVLALAATHAAQAVTWRMATKQPPESVEGRAFQHFADKVKEYSGGEMTIRIFPSEQLGKTEAVLEQVRAGTVHIYPEGAAYLKKWVPAMSYMSAPFMFESREHWARFMESELLAGWLDEVEAKSGITLLGNPAAFMRGPYRVMVTKKPWADLGSLAGVKLRHHPDQLGVDVWTHLGTEVRVLGWTEVYEAIQRGIVEAVNSPIALVEAMKFYEVAPHIVRHDEYPQGVGFMTNARALAELAPALRSALDQAYADAGAYSFRLTSEITSESIERMRAKGVTYSEPELAQLRATMSAYYAELDRAGKLPAGFLDTVEATRSR